MKYANKILQHPKFQEYIQKNAIAEKDNKWGYCNHDIQHAIDVARVAYIMSLEKSLDLDKDIIYSTALLHDIAKWLQHQNGSDHAVEGAALAQKILYDIGMDSQTTALITDAIRSHRVDDPNAAPLNKVLYDADKSCRMCVLCSSIEGCKRFKDGQAPTLMY
jgi:uncharacterized protein